MEGAMRMEIENKDNQLKQCYDNLCQTSGNNYAKHLRAQAYSPRVMLAHIRLKFEAYENLDENQKQDPDQLDCHPPELLCLYDIMRPHGKAPMQEGIRPHPVLYFARINAQKSQDEGADDDESIEDVEKLEICNHFDTINWRAVKVFSDSSIEPADHYEKKGQIAVACWKDKSRMELTVPGSCVRQGELRRPEIPNPPVAKPKKEKQMSHTKRKKH